MGLSQQMQFVMGIFTTAIVLAAQVSTGLDASPSPAILSAIPPIIGTIGSRVNAPTPSASQQIGSSPQSPIPSIPPSIERSSPNFLPQPPVPIRGPALSPSNHREKEPITMNPTYPPAAVASPSHLSPQLPPSIQPYRPGSRIIPPAPAPIDGLNNPPSMRPFLPGAPRSIFPVPFVSPPTISPATDPEQSPFKPPEPKVPETSTPPPAINGKIGGTPIAASPTINPFPPIHLSPKSAAAPSSHKMTRHSKNANNPKSSPKSSPEIGYHSPVSSPNISSLSPHYVRRNKTSQAPSPSTLPPSDKRAPLYPPKSHPGSTEGLHAPSQDRADSSIPPSFSSRSSSNAHNPHTQAPTIPSGKETMRHHSPKFSPSGSSPSSPRIPLPYHGLPPPPPNEECSSISCTEPLTYPVHGSSCVCVVPMQVGLRITVALYTFFPSVAEISGEIASGIFMRQSQVRIMGANADSQDEEKTVVLIDLVPLEEKFDNTTAFLTYMRIWNKQIVLNSSLFGDYEVLYVHYPGLPASPPSSSGIINSVPNHGNNGRTVHPLGVDVSGQQHHKKGISSSIIAIIVLSAFLFLVLCSLFAWIFLFKDRENREGPTPIASLLSASKPSGIGASLFGSMQSSASMSVGSSLAVYNGSAKGFSLIDIKRATDNFNNLRILGEGGFGRVYSGVLEDGSKVAVKVLKRDDLQGGREFLAEVEMLSRLHHRNLVKLIGICTEENVRCLVYELIPNGSVESHLHGVDKEASPLDWGARMKIALGAARGLAYLHEDSSPRVIHRDFKSSNILLEHDFMPKVSDFGLARAAMDEQDTLISTRVMGTFGYVAPEYAMTGHLLVKSDVYSYGVVLLELLTGRKPVDMSQPPGQENLVAWARPMLTTREGFQSIIDPSLGPDFPLDSIAKVVAIASMCVQPEVSHRPFMGEVVQALKLMCNERDDDPSEDGVSIEMDAARSSSSNSDLLFNHLQYCHSPVSNYCSGLDAERGFTVSDIFDNSVRLGRQNTGALRVFSRSGPLRLGGRTREGLWQKLKKLSGGTMSEHGTMSRMWPPPGSH